LLLCRSRARRFPAGDFGVAAGDFLLNYFFVLPLFSFYIADPQNWIALAVFEVSALIVTRLSTQARLQAARALNREREVERLYGFSRELLLCWIEPARKARKYFRSSLQQLTSPVSR